ncbi:lipoate-protein ligase LplJ [bacterium BMS3Bbin12]|nr:lipoate-protein ligase LplJ [bacterium BMS3Abin12]GBE48154.1 lipoate-protein ligase LplJ [bacterium BMS3Bbin12]GBE50011.1 lipoate-protein ligase LplJ [bacterium BMS3Bbin13]
MTARRPGRWRLLDTGLRGAAENIALNRTLLEAHQEGHGPHTLRFLRFSPSALVGFHQSVCRELREDYCRSAGIEIQRRITGGGAIYFDEAQLGWELYLDKAALGSADMRAIAARICEAAAAGLRGLGVDARFRPRNDIEVDGRKISGTGGAFDGDSLLYQGTVLIDFDVERMLRVLRVPAEKLSDKAVRSARERVTSLRELLGRTPPVEEVRRCLTGAFADAFGVSFEAGGLTAHEEAKFRDVHAEIATPEWVYQHNEPGAGTPVREGVHRARGGLLRARIRLDAGGGRVTQAWITGDFFVSPARMVPDLEAALKDTPCAQVRARVEAFFADYPVQMLHLAPADFADVLDKSLAAPPGAGDLVAEAGSGG